MLTKRSFLAVGSAALLVLASCSDDNSSEVENTGAPVETEAPATTGAPTTDTPVESTIAVEGAWARTSPAGVTKGAAYMVITSSIDDRLVDVKVSDEVAMDAQIHEMVMAEGESMSGESMPMTDDTMAMSGDTMPMTDDTMAMSGDTMAPSMVMQEVDAIELPAGEAVALEPGGYHVMLIDLMAPLELGQEFVLTLVFEAAGEVEVTVVVADEAPMG